MNRLALLLLHIANRVSVNQREFVDDVAQLVSGLTSMDKLARYHAFYALTQQHPMRFSFVDSCLSGSYFLGSCEVERSVLYKTDVRGDELKRAGTVVDAAGIPVRLVDNETIRISDSLLVKTLVHCFSHDPESLESFFIRNTAALPWSNIHGALVEGCFIEPFATIDLTTARNCYFGAFSYTQAPDIAHYCAQPGRILVSSPGVYELSYTYRRDDLERYVSWQPGQAPRGLIPDFIKARKKDFIPIYKSVSPRPAVPVPDHSFLSPYAAVTGSSSLSRNVLVARHAVIEDSFLGPGANAQENCFIVGSRLEGNNITAHGGKVVNARLARNTFVGFNSFICGTPSAPLEIGEGAVIMPQTIIDAVGPLEVPAGSLVWGLSRTSEELAANSIPLAELAKASGRIRRGRMEFTGDGGAFTAEFARRIERILEENGAFYDGGTARMGHAQLTKGATYNILQPYPDGVLQGMVPTMLIGPPRAPFGS
jgi:carbonic anhydrase/acetyltransferase-like protein (isoleucine patch superfamily)